MAGSRASAGCESIRSPSCRRPCVASDYRVGTGVDAHALEPGVPLVLGGVSFRSARRPCRPLGRRRDHARADRRAAWRRRTRRHRHALSLRRSRAAGRLVAEAPPRGVRPGTRSGGYELVNADVVLIGQEPKIAPCASRCSAARRDARRRHGPRLGARDDDGRVSASPAAARGSPRRRSPASSRARSRSRASRRRARRTLERRDVPAERVGEPDDHAEEGARRGSRRRAPRPRRRPRAPRRRRRARARRGAASASRGSRASRAASRRTGAVRQSRCTASQTSSPSAYDATAPWAFVQKGHWLSEETNAAKSSRSPSLQSDGPRIARSSASEYGRPKSSGR